MMNESDFLLAYNAARGAYNNAGGYIEGYTYVDSWEAGTGFKAHAYVDGAGNYVLAFAGTDDVRDAYQNLANFGMEQWKDVRPDLTVFFQDIVDDVNKPFSSIHFAGHSLGGALAQYAAYDFVERNVIETNQTTLTTFNALGGVLGLQDEHTSDFKAGILNGATVHHYFDEYDVVARLSEHLGDSSTTNSTYQLRADADPIFTGTAHTLSHIQTYIGGELLRGYSKDVPYFEIDEIVPALQIFASATDGLIAGDEGQVNDVEAMARLISAVSVIEKMQIYYPSRQQWDAFKDFLVDNLVRTVVAPYMDKSIDPYGGSLDEDDISNVTELLSISISGLGALAGSKLGMRVLVGGGTVVAVMSEVYQLLNGAPEPQPADEALTYTALNYLTGATLTVDESGHFDENVSFENAQKILRFSQEDGSWGFTKIVSFISELLGEGLIDTNKGTISLVYRIAQDGIQIADSLSPSDSYDSERLYNWVTEQSPISTITYDPLDARLIRYSVINHLPFILKGVDPQFLDPSILSSDRYALGDESDQYWNHRIEFFQQVLYKNLVDGLNTWSNQSENKYFKDAEVGSILVGENSFGQGGSSTLDKTEVSNVRFGSESDDAEIQGYEHDDYLYGRGGNDTLRGNGGRDYLEGNTGNDALYGGADSDYLYGGKGDDKLYGGEGTDYLIGGDGSDTYYFVNGDGTDFIDDVDAGDRININGKTITSLVQTAPDSNIYEDSDGSDNVYVVGQSGGLTITVKNGNEITGTIKVDKFHRSLNNFGIAVNGSPAPETPPTPPNTAYDVAEGYVDLGDREVDIRKTWEARDADANQTFINENGIYVNLEAITSIWGYAEARNAVGGSLGSNFRTLTDSSGNVTYLELYFHGTDFDDEMHGAYHGEQLFGRGGDDSIFGYAGSDWLIGGLGSDFLEGGDGNDTIIGNSAEKFANDGSLNPEYEEELTTTSNRIDAGEGDDEVSAGEGNDKVIGGLGDDIIWAGSGNDSVNAGDGNDKVFGDSRIELEPSETATFLTSFEFIESADSIRTYDDTISGGKGADHLYGELGNDTLDGGDGDDLIHGDRNAIRVGGVIDESTALNQELHGNDVISGGQGEDRLFGDGGDDVIDGGSEKDVIYGDDYVDNAQLSGAYHGDDVLSGGGGDDTIVGGGGVDTIDGGVGADKIWGDDQGLDGQYHGADILLGGDGGDQIIGGGSDDTITGGEGNDQISGDEDLYEGESVIALNGSYHGHDNIDAGQGDDVVRGGGGNDVIFGGEGNDELWGDSSYEKGNEQFLGSSVDSFISANLDELFHGNDEIYGGAGKDVIVGGGGNDRLFGGTEDDTLYGNSGDDYLEGGAGSDWLIGHDGKDTLSGGQGNDALIGGKGNDTYLIGSSDGNDRVLDVDGANTLVVRGVNRNDLQLDYDSDGAYLALKSDWSQFVFLDGASLSTFTIKLDDGEDLIAEDLAQKHDYSQDPNGRTVTGGNGNDTILASSGNDSISGAQGNDILQGGDGSDTYVFNLGDGQDLVNDSGSLSDTDTIILSGGYSTENTAVAMDGNDLQISSSQSDSLITVENFYSVPTNKIELFEFSDAGNLVVGDGSQNALVGTDHADLISAQGGNDTLEGGLGDDVLVGGDGEDTYVYHLGDGHDQIQDTSGLTSLVLGGGISKEHLKLRDTANGLLLEIDSRDPTIGSVLFDFPEQGFALSIFNYIEVEGDLLSFDQISQLYDGPLKPLSNIDYLDSTRLMSSTETLEHTVPLAMFSSTDGYQIDATLENGDPLPAWLSFDSSQFKFVSDPSKGVVEAVSVTLIASNDYGSTSVNIEFNVPEIITDVSDSVSGSNATHYLDGNSTNYFIGGNGNEVVLFDSGSEDTTIFAGGGNDRLYSSFEGEKDSYYTYYGGEGEDRFDILHTHGSYKLIGGEGDDHFEIRGDQTEVVILPGNDHETIDLRGGVARIEIESDFSLIEIESGSLGIAYIKHDISALGWNIEYVDNYPSFSRGGYILSFEGLPGSLVLESLVNPLAYQSPDGVKVITPEEILTLANEVTGLESESNQNGDGGTPDSPAGELSDIYAGVLTGGIDATTYQLDFSLVPFSGESSVVDLTIDDQGAYGAIDRVMIDGLGKYSQYTNFDGFYTLRRGNDIELHRIIDARTPEDVSLTIKDAFSSEGMIEELGHYDFSLGSGDFPSDDYDDFLTNSKWISGDGNVSGLSGEDYLEGGSGNDNIHLGSGHGLAVGGGGDDVFHVSSTSEPYFKSHVEGGEGVDTLIGTSGDDQFRFTLDERIDVERIDGGEGYDTIENYVGLSTLQLAQTEIVNIEKLLVRPAYNIDASASQSNLTFEIETRARDYLANSLKYTLAAGGAGDDVFEMKQNLFLSTLDDPDWANIFIRGGEGYDKIVFQGGSDHLRLREISSVEEIDGGGGYNVLDAADIMDFSNVLLTNIDLIRARNAVGSNGNDTLQSFGGGLIDGGAGDDTLIGSNSWEWLLSSQGNDHITTNGGSDSVLVVMDGQTTIGLSGHSSFDNVKLYLTAKDDGTPLVSSDLTFDREGDALVISDGLGNSTKIDNWDTVSASTNIELLVGARYESAPSASSIYNMSSWQASLSITDIEARISHGPANGLDLGEQITVSLDNEYRQQSNPPLSREISIEELLSDTEITDFSSLEIRSAVSGSSEPLHFSYSDQSLFVSLPNADYTGTSSVDLVIWDGSETYLKGVSLDVEHANSQVIAGSDIDFRIRNDDYLNGIPLAISLENDYGSSSDEAIWYWDPNANDNPELLSISNVSNGNVEWSSGDDVITFTPDFASIVDGKPDYGWYYDFSFDATLSDGISNTVINVPVHIAYGEYDVLELFNDELNYESGILNKFQVADVLANDSTSRLSGLEVVDVYNGIGGRVDYDPFTDEILFLADEHYLGDAGFWYSARDAFSTKSAWVSLAVEPTYETVNIGTRYNLDIQKYASERIVVESFTGEVSGLLIESINDAALLSSWVANGQRFYALLNIDGTKMGEFDVPQYLYSPDTDGAEYLVATNSSEVAFVEVSGGNIILRTFDTVTESLSHAVTILSGVNKESLSVTNDKSGHFALTWTDTVGAHFAEIDLVSSNLVQQHHVPWDEPSSLVDGFARAWWVDGKYLLQTIESNQIVGGKVNENSSLYDIDSQGVTDALSPSITPMNSDFELFYTGNSSWLGIKLWSDGAHNHENSVYTQKFVLSEDGEFVEEGPFQIYSVGYIGGDLRSWEASVDDNGVHFVGFSDIEFNEVKDSLVHAEFDFDGAIVSRSIRRGEFDNPESLAATIFNNAVVAALVNENGEISLNVEQVRSKSVLQIEASSLLNFDDALPNTFNIVSVEQAQNGQVFLDQSSGLIIYNLDAGFVGQTSFIYTVSDGEQSFTKVAAVEALNIIDEAIAYSDPDDDTEYFAEGSALNDYISVSNDESLTEVHGGEGNDVIELSHQQSFADGGKGDDAYIIRSGHYTNYYGDDFGENTIRINSEIDLENSYSSRTANRAIFHFSTPQGIASINVRNVFAPNSATSAGTNLPVFESADGTETSFFAMYESLLDMAGDNNNNDISGTTSADELSGLAGYDSISGYEGNDTLEGGAGNDYLLGGEGDDTYIFSAGDGYDWISAGTSENLVGSDTLVFEDVNKEALWFVDNGYSHDVYLLGSSDKVSLYDWSSKKHLDTIETADGFTLDLTNDSIFQNLISTMASYGVPNSNGDMQLTEDERNQVHSAIAAAWSE